MVKNTGIPDNQLSDLDFGQVLKDSHNKSLHAIDVNQINSLVNSKYSKIVPTYNECGQIINIKYYGLGLSEIIKLSFPSNIKGSSEFSTFIFTNQTGLLLDGKYVTIYDQNGKVTIWFNLDSSSVQPTVTGTSRYIEVPISSSDIAVDLASKFSVVLNNDTFFNASSSSILAVVQTVQYGNFTDATIGDTSLLLSIVDGVENLAGKLFYLYSYDNSIKYSFYYTVDGIGTQPSHTGYSIFPIAILSSDSIATIANKTSLVINNNAYFVSNVSGNEVIVTYRPAGDTMGFLDSNSRLTSTTIQNGTNMDLVQEIIINYETSCGKISSIQALL